MAYEYPMLAKRDDLSFVSCVVVEKCFLGLL